MKVVKVEIIPITKLRFKRSFKISGGEVGSPEMKWGFPVIARIYTDDGIVGLGDTIPENPFQPETTWSVVAALKNFYAPLVLGEDPFNIEKLIIRMDGILPGNPFARTPIDFALYDIMGKAAGVPLYKLMGGLCHDRIRIKFPVGIGSKEEMVRNALELVEDYKVDYIKLKIGPTERWRKDIEAVEAIREAVGEDVEIQVDANAGYDSPHLAIKVFKEMEKQNIVLAEQPLPGWDLEGMAQVVRAIDTPILADESVYSLQDAYKVIKMKAADVINIKVAKAGGLNGSKKIAAVGEAAGVPIFVGAIGETGIGAAACAHLYASTKNVWPATPFMNGWYLWEHDLLTEETRIKLKDGYVEPPKKPGLGVEVDEDILAKYSDKIHVVK